MDGFEAVPRPGVTRPWDGTPKPAAARSWETRQRAKAVEAIPTGPEGDDPPDTPLEASDDFGSSAKPPPVADQPGDGAPKKRGRQPGSKNAPAVKRAPKEIIDSGAAVLVIAHDWVALKRGNDRWELEDKEANQLSEALINVLNYYGLQLDKKKSVWGALIVCLIMVEGSRIMGEIVEMRAKKATHAVQTPGSEFTV